MNINEKIETEEETEEEHEIKIEETEETVEEENVKEEKEKQEELENDKKQKNQEQNQELVEISEPIQKKITKDRKYKYTLHIDPKDPKDHIKLWLFDQIKRIKIPKSFDLRPNMIPVFDQEDIGSCTANAISACYSYQYCIQHETVYIPSRLFIYYNERLMTDRVNIDAGSSIKDGIKTLNKYGTCSEEMWPYTTSKFMEKPPESIYKEALKNRALSFARISADLMNFKIALSNKKPVVFGFVVPASFEEITNDGFMSYSLDFNKYESLGGHAVLACGFDDNLVNPKNGQKGHLIVRNSWSSKWGFNGYFFMPYTFVNVIGHISDCWIITLVN